VEDLFHDSYLGLQRSDLHEDARAEAHSKGR